MDPDALDRFGAIVVKVKKVDFLRKSLGFCWEIWLVEGLESVEEEEEYEFWSFLRVRIVGKFLGKFEQSNGVKF